MKAFAAAGLNYRWSVDEYGELLPRQPVAADASNATCNPFGHPHAEAAALAATAALRTRPAGLSTLVRDGRNGGAARGPRS